jgi:hypothetical protein
MSADRPSPAPPRQPSADVDARPGPPGDPVRGRRRGAAIRAGVALGVLGVLLGGAALVLRGLGIAPPGHSPLVRRGWGLVDPDARPAAPGPSRRAIGLGAGPVVINEVMTANPEAILDEDFAPSDWIELYNRSDAPVHLRDWALAQGGRSRHRWMFPDVVLSPRRTLVVWASGKDRVGSAASRFIAIRLDPGALGSRTFDGTDRPEHPLWYRDGEAPRYRLVEVVLEVPRADSYVLWLRLRDLAGSGSRLRVTVDGRRAQGPAMPLGSVYRHVRVGPRGAAPAATWPLAAGRHVVQVAAAAGVTEVERVTLTGSAGIDDPYGLHLHTSFRLRHTGEAVTLLDPAGVVRDEVTPADFEAGLSLQREPAGGPWAGLRPPSPGGMTVRPAPDLSAYPSVSATPLRLVIAPPAGVDELRYTRDGSVPGDASPRLEGSLEIARSGVVRLRGYTAGKPSTPIVTRQFWIGPLPRAAAVMLALDSRLVSDPELGFDPNNVWRKRPQTLPGPPALRALQRTRDREWAAWRSAWTKPAHLLLLDAAGVLFDGPVRVRGQSGGPEGSRSVHVSADPVLGAGRLNRDLFEPALGHPPRSFVIDTSNYSPYVNQRAYDLIRASGGIAPRARPATYLLNGARAAYGVNPPEPVVTLVEDVDGDFLESRWGHREFDLVKGKPFRVLRGSLERFETLADRVERGGLTAAELAPWVDLPALTALHFALVFLDSSRHGEDEGFQGYMAFDRTRRPALLRPIAWDVDQALRRPTANTFTSMLRVLGRFPARSRFLPARIVGGLLQDDPAYREQYLRHAEWAMNHAFRPERWPDPWRAVGESAIATDVQDAIQVFLRERPPYLRAVLARVWSLPDAAPVRVEVVGGGRLLIDGQVYGARYEGAYFAGGRIRLEVPDDARGAFRHFVVSGDVTDRPVLDLPVRGALEIRAVFRE